MVKMKAAKMYIECDGLTQFTIKEIKERYGYDYHKYIYIGRTRDEKRNCTLWRAEVLLYNVKGGYYE